MSVAVSERLSRAYGRDWATIKVFCNWTMVTTATINESLAVSSLTDNGTGDTTINMSRTMSSANYSVSAGGQFDQVARDQAPEKGYRRNDGQKGVTTPTAAFRYCFSSTSSGFDCIRASVTAIE